MALFRIAQEAQRNVEKYARATNADVTLFFETSREFLTIVDYGVGFSVPKSFDVLVAAGKIGLVGLKERTVLIGGAVEGQSASGKDTKVSVAIPGGVKLRDVTYTIIALAVFSCDSCTCSF